MLTIEQLDLIKQSSNSLIRLERGYCNCGATKAHIYAYIFGGKYTNNKDCATDIYWECDVCLEEDEHAFKHTKIVKLSLKEIFYLKI